MNRKMMLILCTVLAPAASQLACSINLPVGGLIVGNGKVVTESRQVSGFSAVSFCCGMDLVLSQGVGESLELEMEENILPHIETVVQGSTLLVRFRDDRLTGISATKPMIVRLTMVDISEVDISGGGRLDGAAIESDSLKLDLSGGSRAEIDQISAVSFTSDLSGDSHAVIDQFSAGSFTADLGGGSSLQASGEIDQLTLNMSGGDSDLGNLACSGASIDLPGGASAILWVTQTLSADLSGGSHLRYYGSPTLGSINLSGGSGMNSLGEK